MWVCRLVSTRAAREDEQWWGGFDGGAENSVVVRASEEGEVEREAVDL